MLTHIYLDKISSYKSSAKRFGGVKCFRDVLFINYSLSHVIKYAVRTKKKVIKELVKKTNTIT